MPELKITLEALFRCERELDQLGREGGRLPDAIAAARSRAQAARDAIEAEREKLARAEQQRREKEAELADCEAQKTKYEGQTALVKTNEEYTALLREIDTMGQRISQVEEEILLAMEAADEVSSQLEAFTSAKQRDEESANREADQHEGRLKQVEAERDEREREREGLAAELPANAIGHYKRVHDSLGAGTSNVKERVCSACHRDVPYETINRVKAGELLTCLSCARVLVVIDE